MLRKYKFVSVVFLIALSFVTAYANHIHAQAQDFNFSGNDPDSYQCIKTESDATGSQTVDLKTAWGGTMPATSSYVETSSGKYLCPSTDSASGVALQKYAVLKPATLEQVEVWFYRILYVIWALVGSLSFFMLVVLGYRYMISRGDVTKITEIRQRIIYYIIGLALVFLAIPILTTIFNLLNVNKNVKCYNVSMPGFQFFFADLCTDPKGVILDPCDDNAALEDAVNGDETGRYACAEGSADRTCTKAYYGVTYEVKWSCNPDTLIWTWSSKRTN